MSEQPTSLDVLIDKLKVNSCFGESWRLYCSSQLAALQKPEHMILAYLEALPEEDLDSLFDGSHDTSTHYKWLIYRSTGPRFTLWLHEYKNPASRGPGYAQVPHDHRYDIVSLILNGGYIASVWQLSGEELIGEETLIYQKTDVMNLSHDKIHSLKNILSDTLTLVIEGPRIKAYSTAYYPSEKRKRTFPDFPARWPYFKDKLSSCLDDDL